ncbi:universal stress protein [Arthrobacter bambusae]|uniref:universal stress protein n=1 Tax=Arthrobacter bambusae TaxID=1338426 RepID=UPI002782F40E|nr:universal stress protein [Arthrobacter bambusae]MDQ0028705.1 nucleotide-binding universal stress UspA family protein [Arthrobacter bambusae]MDQ0096501.1 nucleotide-binding universal stress UspA family protein [Arthrobacter bambusae]
MNTEPTSNRVIVGVDGSEYSSAALQWAGRMAVHFDIPLEVITCVGTSDLILSSRLEPGLNKFTAQLEESAKELVEQAVHRAFDTKRPENLTVTVKFGAPAKVLVEESRNATLLVIGRHGGGGFLDQAIGSVSHACAAHAKCPVLLVTQEAGNN